MKNKKTLFFTIFFIIVTFLTIASTVGPLIVQNRVENWLTSSIAKDIPYIAPNSVLIGDVSVGLTGRITIKNLVVNNAVGFSAPYALKIDEVIVSVSLWQLFTNFAAPIYYIDNITVQNPTILVEKLGSKLNVDIIRTPTQDSKSYTPNANKRFILNNLTILDGTISRYYNDMPSSAIITPAKVIQVSGARKISFRKLYFILLDEIIEVGKDNLSHRRRAIQKNLVGGN